MKVIENYEKVIENSDESLLKEVFAPQVRIEIPAGASDNHPGNTASYSPSQVAKTAPAIKCVLSADAGNNGYFLGFEGKIEGQKHQAGGGDQLHLNKDGKIDQLIIYMRPFRWPRSLRNSSVNDFSLRAVRFSRSSALFARRSSPSHKLKSFVHHRTLLPRYPHFPPQKEKSVTHVSGTIYYQCFGSLTAVWNRCPICPILVLIRSSIRSGAFF